MGIVFNADILTRRPTQSSEYINPHLSSKYGKMIYFMKDFSDRISASQTLLNYNHLASERMTFKNWKEKYIDSVQIAIQAVNNSKVKLSVIIDEIIKKLSDIQEKDSVSPLNKYSMYQQERLLQSALYKADLDHDYPDISLNVSNLELCDHFLEKISEKIDLISNEDLFSQVLTCSKRIWHDPEFNINDCIEKLNNTRARLMFTLFGNNNYQSNSCCMSAHDLSNQQEIELDDDFSCQLFGQAYDNVDMIPKIINSLQNISNTYKTKCNILITYLEQLIDNIHQIAYCVEETKLDIDLEKCFAVNQILKRGLDIFRSVVDVTIIMIGHKLQKLYNILTSSEIVKSVAKDLILKYSDIEDPRYEKDLTESFMMKWSDVNNINYTRELNPSVFNGHNQIKDLLEMQEDFCICMELLNEDFKNYEELTSQILLEADDQQQQTQNGATPQTQNNTIQAVGAAIQNKATAVANWLGSIMDRFSGIFERFKNRVQELIIKNGPDQAFWKNNKDAIYKMNLNDTKANDWYQFNFDALGKSGIIPNFDPSQAYMQSDEAFQQALIKQITKTPPAFDANDSFAQKISKIYQGPGPISDQNSDGQPLSALKYNHKQACNYVDSIIANGFSSPYLGDINKDYQTIETSRKNVKMLQQQYAAKNQVSNNAAPVKEETVITRKDDFGFNLAEHFGLITNEASFAVGQQTAQSAKANGASQSDSSPFDAMTKRYFNYSTTALTTKMTCVIAAYKQYLSLFKAVCKQPAQQQAQNESVIANTIKAGIAKRNNNYQLLKAHLKGNGKEARQIMKDERKNAQHKMIDASNIKEKINAHNQFMLNTNRRLKQLNSQQKQQVQQQQPKQQAQQPQQQPKQQVQQQPVQQQPKPVQQPQQQPKQQAQNEGVGTVIGGGLAAALAYKAYQKGKKHGEEDVKEIDAAKKAGEREAEQKIWRRHNLKNAIIRTTPKNESATTPTKTTSGLTTNKAAAGLAAIGTAAYVAGRYFGNNKAQKVVNAREENKSKETEEIKNDIEQATKKKKKNFMSFLRDN